MMDQAERYIASKAKHAMGNIMRNKLQLVARNLMQKIYQVKGNEQRSNEDVWSLIGEIEGYLLLRNTLSPDVAPDGYMRELKGQIGQLRGLVCQKD